MVGAKALRRRDVARYGKNFTVLLVPEARRDQAAAVLGGLNDHDPERKTADDPVPDGKIFRLWGRAQRKLRDQSAGSHDFLGQAFILPRQNHTPTPPPHPS